jgi:hypothetical protein
MAGKISFQALAAAALLAVIPAHLIAETPLERAQRALDQPAKMEFVDTPFKDVLAAMAEHHRVPIKVLRETYEAGYVLRDQPVTVFHRDISLRSALNLTLDRLDLDYLVTERGELLVFAAEPQARAKRPVSRVQLAAAEKNRLLLEKKIVTVQFVDTPLKDVIAFISDEVGVEFVLDREAIEGVGLQPDSPITTNLQEMPLHRAMTALLYPYDLGIELRDEVFYVTLRDERQPRRPIPDEFRRAALAPVRVELLSPPLHEAIWKCADQADVTIIFDHQRMERAGIAYDTRVVGPLPKLPLRDALQKMLEPIGLRAMVYEEVLFITPVASVKPLK